MVPNIFKNNRFGGPTYFDRRWATCLGSRQEGRTGLAKQKGKKGGPPSVKVAHVYVVLRYYDSHHQKDTEIGEKIMFPQNLCQEPKP